MVSVLKQWIATRSIRFSSLLAAAIAIAAVSLPGAAVADPDKAWDQAAVTALAQQLPPITEKLYTAIYQEGQLDDLPGAMGAGDAYHGFKQRIQEMNIESMRFADELKKGKGRKDTKHSFERIEELNDDAEEFAERQFMEHPVSADFKKLDDLLDQLEDYYGD